MRTVNEDRKRIEELNKDIKEAEARIRALNEYVIELKGEQKGILYTLSTSEEKKDAVLRPKS